MNWLRWLLQSPERDDVLAHEIRARQFRACMQLMPITAPINCALVIASTWAFYDVTTAWLLIASLFIVIATELDSLFHYFYSRVMNRDIEDHDLLRVVVRSALVPLGLIGPTVFWFPDASVEMKMLLIAAVAGLIGAGGFVLSPLAAAGVAWAATATLFGAIALALADRPIFWVLFALLMGYGAMICMVVITSSTALVARVRAEARAERQHELVNLLLKDFEGSSRDWLWETDQQGHLRHVSIRLTEAFGRAKKDLENLSLVDLLRGTFSVTGRDEVEAHDHLRLRLSSRQPFRDQVVPVVIGSEVKWWSLAAKPLFNNQRIQVGWRGVGSDVTEAQRREIEMTHLANFDPLTTLANRRQFRSYLDATLKSNPFGEQVMLLVLDLDNFKTINDTLGHLVGDQVLHDVALLLQSTTCEGELLARLGGDEYALIVPGDFDDEQCLARGHRLLEALREPLNVGETLIEIRGSVGVAYSPLHGTRSDELMKAADTALYAAKDAGRDAVRLFTGEMEERARTRLSIQNDLSHALEKNEFEVHYQPQVNARTMEIVGFEALLRWRRSADRLVSPNEFIPIAEETGLIVPIGTWVLQQACRDAVTWPETLFVAVNLSAVQFASRGLLDAVTEAVDATFIAPERLELEITESSLIEDSSHARETLKKLRWFGHRIALDDFGTGYSSLAYLRSFPIDKLKIDGAFTSALAAEDHGDASAIVRAIIQLAGALRLKTTAEGVESRAQLDSLRAKGCQEIQGFYVAPPMPAREIAAFLEAWAIERPRLLNDKQLYA